MGFLGAFVEVVAGTKIGSEAIRQVSALPSNLVAPTQSFVALGVVGTAANAAKKVMKI